ncbi:hypothetical protein Moror_6197 [Moniliophthora roreri MCA 2997]|uniref:DUF6534 domain-containing protein n=1 Tax=Moniliophthora roreri (strain MCA 2997) TaxID=1381753 RepID=V2WCA5_MONRO|nr:hypothetical protein Moror_6197 [Moniliophthora roreri MCA 2997]
MPLNDQDKSLGGLLVGTWVNSYLFMTELIMSYRYFSRYRNDPIWIKLLVVITLMVDLISTINQYVCVYLYTITHWGDTEYLNSQQWQLPTHLITTGISALIVQNFLIWRFWMLSKNWYISLLLVGTSMSGTAGSLAAAVIIIQHPGYEYRGAVRIPASIWLGLSAVTDVSITAILIYTLRRMKTNLQKTKNLIKRLTTLAIQTGSPGSAVATIALIVYFRDIESNITVGIAFTLGRVYALTMLHNLNSRAYVRQMGSHTPQGTEDSTTPLTVGETFLRDLQTENLTDTRDVNRTAVVHTDGQTPEPLQHVEGLPTDDHDRKNSDVKPSVPPRNSVNATV